MSIFDAYDQEFASLSRDINKNIGDFRSASNADKSTSAQRLVEGLLSQASDLIKQMEVEVRSHDAATRKVLSEKVNQYKKSLAAHRSDYESVRDSSQRATLLGKSGEQRQRFLDTNEKLDRQNEKIMNMHKTVAETEDVAMEITNELARNREKIESSHSKVREFTGMTDTARRLIQSMSRREIQQKMILAFIAVVLIIAISVTAYYATKGK